MLRRRVSCLQPSGSQRARGRHPRRDRGGRDAESGRPPRRMSVSPTPLAQATRDKLARVGTANLANALLSHGVRNAYMLGVAPLSADQERLIGPAYTLRFIPAREDIDTLANYRRTDNLHRRAIEECP